MNNKSGDCLGIEIDYNPNKIVRTPVKDKDLPVEIEKLKIVLPPNTDRMNETENNIWTLGDKINEIIDVVNKLDKLLKGFHRSDTNKHNQ